MKLILYLATVVSILTYSFWQSFPKGYFYYGNSFFITLICAYIYYQDKKNFIKFFLFELSIANLIKELFLDPGKLELGEALLIVIIPIIWYFNNDKYNRILERDRYNRRWYNIFYSR